MARPLDRQNAKDELKRIDQKLKNPLLLVGGLAVQQYHEPRSSRDIDLVCDHDTALRLVNALYPSKDWDVQNSQTDARPSYTIENKISGMKVYFGPKILQREEYPNLPWNVLMVDARPFRHSGETYLSNILVPSAHNLAYSKLISFINRYSVSPEALVDLDDFVHLTNRKEFSISELYSTIRRNSAQDRLVQVFAEIKSKDSDIASRLDNSCLSYFTELLQVTSLRPNRNSDREIVARCVYCAAPHKNVDRNQELQKQLKLADIAVKLPFIEVERVCGVSTPADGDRVRSVCMDTIRHSQALLVDVDTYGLDTAWEIGYADGLGKPVFGLTLDLLIKNNSRTIARRPYNENFMHGWDGQTIYRSVSDLVAELKDSTIYICGSFKNKEVRTIKKHLTHHKFKHVIFPLDHVPKDTGLPRDYPLQTRTKAIAQLDSCDALVVILPRYGMDASWQIGYATAKGKKVVGLMQSDDGNGGSSKVIWDHWMHGWNEKDIFWGYARASAALKGYFDFGIIS